jgi:hypothetical protein
MKNAGYKPALQNISENKKAPNRVGAQHYPRISLQDHNAFFRGRMS